MYSNAKITNSVERGVEALRAIAQVAQPMLGAVEETLKEWNGQKITKVDGWYTKSFEEVYQSLQFKPELKHLEGHPHRIALDKSYGYVCYKIEYWVSFGQSFFDRELTRESSSDGDYYKIELPIGKIDDQKLQLNNEWLFNARCTLEEHIQRDYKEIEKIRQAKIGRAHV